MGLIWVSRINLKLMVVYSGAVRSAFFKKRLSVQSLNLNLMIVARQETASFQVIFLPSSNWRP